jgi:SSS family solute:Na+ symporter
VQLTTLDILTFVGFLALVVFVSLWASRKEKSGEDYFLAGRGLTWPLIGFSLIAANISAEQMVGMSGAAANGEIGLSIASYEWMAAITLVCVGFFFLPMFLKSGIYTIPQFLEFRFSPIARTVMSLLMVVMLVSVNISLVTYLGAKFLDPYISIASVEFGFLYPVDDIAILCWIIGITAGVYVAAGGLKACAWADIIQGAALIVGAIVIISDSSHQSPWAARRPEDERPRQWRRSVVEESAGVVDRLLRAQRRQDARVPAVERARIMPWTRAHRSAGSGSRISIYWGLNQYIMQRALGAKSLAEGQRGIFLACFFKLLIPFIIVFPGIIAFQLYGDAVLAKTGGDVAKAGELAYPTLIAEIMPPVLRGVMLAALAGAVMSSFNSGINSAATIFTIDVYKRYLSPHSDTKRQLRVGQIATAVIAVAACLIAPLPGSFEGVFAYIQEIWGFISPGIVAAFLMGIWLPKAPTIAGKLALLLSPLLYAICRVPKWILDGQGFSMQELEGVSRVVQSTDAGQAPVEGFRAMLYQFGSISFLHHMAIIFVIIAAVMILLTRWKPRSEPVTYPTSNVDVRVPLSSYLYGSLIIAATIALYVYFW